MFFYTKSQFRYRAGMAKILLVMRLIIVLLTTAILQVSAAGYAQRVTLKQNNAPLATVLDEIRKQTGYDFLYSDRVMNTARRVSLNLSDVSVDEALEICFKDQPLSYKVEDKMVIIKPKEPTFLERLANRWAAIDVHGRVVDQEGKPLPGATVKIKSSGKSVSTNAKGEFYLEKVDEEEVLVISFIGYVSKEVNAVKEMGNIVLEVNDSKLDEVQVIAYGTTTRRLSTGNISSITSADIEKQPVTNPLLALSGRVPGVFIEQSTGLPGGAVKVRIQGTNSFRGEGNEPLYVIDGVPYPSTLVRGLSTGIANVGENSSPLNFINPSDIERIDVLKDADATSIYGSRAANGAILITTKKGKAGTMKADVNLQHGIGKMLLRLELLNTEQFVAMRKEAAKNDGIDYINDPRYNNPSGPFRDLLTWDQHRYTDWQKELLNGTAQYGNYSMSISRGSANTNYLLGGTYHKETTIFERNSANSFGNLHFSLNSRSVNQKFQIQFSGNYQSNINKLAGYDLTVLALSLAPNAPALYNPDGTLNWAPASNGNSTWDNPLANLLKRYQNKTSNLVTNVNLSYELIPNLIFTTSLGYTNLQSDEFITSPSSAGRPERRNGGGSSGFSNSNNHSWIADPQVAYKKLLGKHSIDLLLGTTFHENKRTSKQISASGFSTEQVLEDIRSATSITANGASDAIYKYTAVYGRLNYNYDNRYIFNLTTRNDGSSRFGPANRFHSFASVAAAWIFSNEAGLHQLFPFFSSGKIRGSYGTTGNDQLPDYSYLTLYDLIEIGRPYQGTKGIGPGYISNPYLQWEATRKLSVGVDLGFNNDRLLFNATYSQNRSSNQLIGYDLPITTGFNGIQTNFPATLQNTSWEFALNSINIRKNEFSWSSSLNLTIPKNMLVSFPGLAGTSYANEYIIGKSVNIQKFYRWKGVNPETGLHQFQKANGSLSSYPDFVEDRVVVINPDPKLYGGLQNSFSYKGVSLDIFITYVNQVANKYNFGTGFNSNQPISVLSRWQQKGDVTAMQRFVTGQLSSSNQPLSAFNYSDGQFGDASYLRVKNVSLSWQLPGVWTKTARLQQARVYLQGQNLFTFTNYTGLDPENRSTASLPPLKVITVGLQLTL